MSRRARKGRRALAAAAALLVIGAPVAAARPIGSSPTATRAAVADRPVDLRSPDAKAAEIASRAVVAPAVDLRSPDAKAAEIASGAVQGTAVDPRSPDAKAATLRPYPRGAAVFAARSGHRQSTGSDARDAGIGIALLAIALAAIGVTARHARRRATVVAGASPIASR